MTPREKLLLAALLRDVGLMAALIVVIALFVYAVASAAWWVVR